MSKPIFCATHPRACSTAFERVFMTRKDLACVHEPFGDAFYYGPERMSVRYANDEAGRHESGYSKSTYQTIFDRFNEEASGGKRLFIKDMLYYLIPPHNQVPQIAPSLLPSKRGIGTEANGAKANGTEANGTHRESGEEPFPYNTHTEPGNPTIIPKQMLDQFHFTFLIRDPHSSIPSYYRCVIPPLDEVTGWNKYLPSEAGYVETRRFLDYLLETGDIGPNLAGSKNAGEATTGQKTNVDICLLDADDLLDDPEGILRVYCDSVGLEYSKDMLEWNDEENQDRAKQAFEKWKGWHDDALESKDLKPRAHKKAAKSEEQWDAEWKAKYGEKAAKIIRDTVDANMEDYLYLKKFTLKKS